MASTILTKKQQDELLKAVAEFLRRTQLTQTVAKLEEETGIEGLATTTSEDDGKSSLLEKKWISVVRLQKKVMELESKLAQAVEELSKGPSLRKDNPGQKLPRAPETHTLTGHRAPVNSCAFHPVFSLLATASEDTTIKIWDHESGEFERTIKGHTKSVSTVSFNPKGTLLASCSADLTVKLWDVENDYQCVKTFHGHDHTISALSFTPSGEFILTVSRDKLIKVWEVSTGYCVKTLSGHDDWVRCVAIESDGKMAITGSNDQTVRIWELPGGDCRAELRGHEHVVECVEFIPASLNSSVEELTKMAKPIAVAAIAGPTVRFAVSGSRDKSIRLWDIATGQCIHVFNGHENWVRGLCILSATYLVSVGDDKLLKIWDLKTGRCLKTIEAHEHFVTCVRSSAGVLVTGSVDQTVKVWK